MKKVKIIFFGSDPWSQIVLAELEKKFIVSAVVTTPNSAVANSFKGKILTPEKLDSNFHSELLTLNLELFIVASYGKIIPQEVLDIPEYGALNVHPSLLPIYRGPSPIPTTILNGDKETGVTIIKMDAEVDHGPILFTEKISLSGKEDFSTLITKLFHLGGKLLVKVIPDFIEGKLNLEEQDHQKAVFCERLKKEDGYFKIDNPPSSDKLDRMIRALTPWPGVWTKWNGKIVKFYPAEKIQMEGKKILPLKDFLNGYPNFPLKSI